MTPERLAEIEASYRAFGGAGVSAAAQELIAACRELMRDRDALQKALDDTMTVSHLALLRERDENARLREALEWYAALSIEEPVKLDFGERARAALSEKPQ